MKLNNFLKIIFSFVLIVFIYINLDNFKLLTVVEKTSWRLIALAIIAFCIVKFFGALRYTMLLSSLHKVSFLKIFKIEIIMGLMSYTVLPGLTAEISRVYLVIKEFDFNKSQTILSIAYDRAVGLAGNITTTIFGLILFLISQNFINIFLGVILFIFFMIIMIVFMFSLLRIKDLLLKIKINLIKTFLIGLMEIGQIIEQRKKTIISAYCFSILMQISNVIGVYLISISIGQEIPLHVMMLIVPTIGIILSIPISFAGLGVRELSYITALDFINTTKEISFLIGIYTGLVVFFTNLLLFVCYKICEYSIKFYYR